MHEVGENVGTQLRVVLPREPLGPSGEGFVRKSRNGDFFSTRDREPELESGSSGSQLLNFCYPTGSAATPLGSFFS